MTLLLTVATKDALYLSSDYRLSNQGQPTETANGAKQLTVHNTRWFAQISFTGVAKDGYGYDTRAWIQDAAVSTVPDSPLELFVDALVRRGEQAVSTIQGYDNRLTVVIAAIDDRTCRLFIASNWEVLFAPPPQGRGQFRSCELVISKPKVLVHGNAQTVPRSLRRWIQRLVAGGAGRARISSALATANEFAAKRSGDTISPGCWVQSLVSDGNSSGQNYGDVPGSPSRIFGGVDRGRWFAAEFPAVPGKKLTLVQCAGYFGPRTPAPAEIGPPRTALVSSPTCAVSIKLGEAGQVVGTLSISGSSSYLTLRKNQQTLLPLRIVDFNVNPITLRAAKPFHAKRLRLPCVPTVDGAQPRNWNYLFDLKYDGETLEVTVSQNSVAFRSANAIAPLPVLGSNEELVMSVPLGGLTLNVTSSDPRNATQLQAQFLLRDFPELGRNRPEGS
jgi:hypothetical protein